MTIGVDVSMYQGKFSLPKLFAAGAGFGIIKATQATFTDPAFTANAKALVASGKPGGYYHFVDPDMEGGKQAETFAKAVNPILRDVDGLFIDVERGRQGPKVARAMARRLGQLVGPRKITLYTSFGYWRGCGNPDATDVFDGLWLAFYTEHRQPLDKDVDTSSVSFKARGLAGFSDAPLVQFGPLMLNGNQYDGNVYNDAAPWQSVFGKAPHLPPITERPRYRKGYTAAASLFRAAVDALNVPDPGQGPAWELGVEAARADALAALSDVGIGEPA